MLGFVLLLLEIISGAVIFIVLAALILGMLYLARQEIRDLVHDFENWALKRRLKRKLVRKTPVLTVVPPAPKYATIYDEMMAERKDDDRFFQKIEEYRNDIA